MAPQAQGPFDAVHFLKGGVAGGICCGITHGALCPVDVVKTRIQLDPVKYNRGMVGGFSQVIKVRLCVLCRVCLSDVCLVLGVCLLVCGESGMA